MTDNSPLLRQDKSANSGWNYGSAMEFSAGIPNLNGPDKSLKQEKKPLKSYQTYETQQFSIKFIDKDEPERTVSSNNATIQNDQKQSTTDGSKKLMNANSAEWIPDEHAPFCTSCYKKFNWRLRRHHCRICGRVFCSNCSQTSEITVNGEQRKMIVCKKDLQLHTQLVTQINKQKILLRDQVSPFERMQDTNQFLENSDFQNRDFQRRETSQRSTQNFEMHMNPFIESQEEFQFQPKSRNSLKMRKDTIIQPVKDPQQLAMTSQTNKQAMEKFLEKNAGEDEKGIFGDRDTVTGAFRGTVSDQPINKPLTDRKETLRDQMKNWIDKKLSYHIQQMIDEVIKEFGIDSAKWRRMMIKSTQNAVQTIRPSSRLLNDSIDFNSFIKIITLEYPNQEKCQYVNGVVFKKDVAHRRMKTEIENPRILILQNSLGYVQDDEQLVDLSAEINQENYNMQIIMSKIQSVDPHIIFVEHEASRLALETLFKDQRTVVTNVHPKMMSMIARSTQTIICPSTNLIDKNFIVGSCLKFRVEHIEPMRQFDLQPQGNFQTLKEHTSLMFLEGCQSKLGCSIVLSGPDLKELKTIRMAMKKCLATARVFLLEREYLRFIHPDPNDFVIVPENKADQNHEEEKVKENIEICGVQVANFSTNEDKLTKGEAQKKKAAAWNRKDDPEFKILESPFLYEKEMKRDYLVFEFFSLVMASHKDLVEESSIDLLSESLSPDEIIDTSMRRFSVQKSTPTPDDSTMNEYSIKQKLKQMCTKPQKQLVKFYNEEADISIYQMIKKLATQALQACENKDCKKLRLYHTDYYYHNNGCVEIKYREESAPDIGRPKLTEQDNYTISIVCYCNQCKAFNFNKIEAPTQMLEMSFYKLLEQFFYNQKIVAFGQSNSMIDSQCTHSFHRHCSMIFCYGPIKIMFTYEPLDNYVIDLQHFASVPGIFGKEALRERAIVKFGDMQRNLTDSFYFIEEKAKYLLEWLKAANEEFTTLVGAGINPMMGRMISYVEELLKEINTRRDSFFKELFGIELSKPQIEEENPFASAKARLMDKLSCETKVNQVLMHIGKRLSELLFLLRKAHFVVLQKFIPKVFGKRNHFIAHVELVQKKVSAVQNSLLQTSDETTSQKSLASSMKPSESHKQFSQSVSAVQNSEYFKMSVAQSKQNQQQKKKKVTMNKLMANAISNKPKSQAIENGTDTRNASQPQDSKSQNITQPQLVNLGESKQNSAVNLPPSQKQDQAQKVIFNDVMFQLHGDSKTKLTTDNNITSPMPSRILREGYVEIADFENQLQHFQAIASLVLECCLDSGFDENKVSVDGQDICSIIAYTLYSNLYIQGLAKIEYMQMQQNIKPFRERASDIGKDSTEFALKQFGRQQVDNKLMISPDVLNDKISMANAEDELMRENHHFNFIMNVTTSTDANFMQAMQVFKQGEEITTFTNEDTKGKQMPQKRFYMQRNEESPNLQFIEQPIVDVLIKKLVHLESSVDKMKVNYHSPKPQKLPSGNQSAEEMDFAALALGKMTTNPKSVVQAQQPKPQLSPNQIKYMFQAELSKPSVPKKEPETVMIQIIEGSDDVDMLRSSQDIALGVYTLHEMHNEIYHLFHRPLDFNVKVYFPNQFEALRKVYCGSYTDFLQSIYKSEIWSDNSGGKTKSPFLKSHDHKYVIKIVKHGEIKMFESMSDSYFEYLSKSFTQQQPSALSKILGMYRVKTRQQDGKISTQYCILMENLLLGVDETVAIKYDLKGSERNRYVVRVSPRQVTLDTNFLYDMKSRPIPMQFQMRKVLQIAMANDSLHLAKHQIIDYSLFLIIDPIRKSIRVGIIDYIQMYTLDKELESFLKKTVGNTTPTIIDPYSYRARFRTAIDKYFIGMIPDEDCSFNNLINSRFKAQEIKWFTKESELDGDKMNI